MRTFARKQKTDQEAKSASSTRPGRTFSGQSREAGIILSLQRTIGNQAVQRSLKASAQDLSAVSATTTSTGFAHDFSQIPLYAKTHAKIQPKLTISNPGNIYEQEADRVADQVMSMPEPVAVRQELNPQPQSRRSNQPLSSQEKAFFEPRFGHDFSRVRIHADERAALRAGALGAHAFTVGEDIFFSRGACRLGDDGGRNLLAHELAHVVQQTAARGGVHTGMLSHSLSRAPIRSGPTEARRDRRRRGFRLGRQHGHCRPVLGERGCKW
jgi:Zn-dependent protease with chaperone function